MKLKLTYLPMLADVELGRVLVPVCLYVCKTVCVSHIVCDIDKTQFHISIIQQACTLGLPNLDKSRSDTDYGESWCEKVMVTVKEVSFWPLAPDAYDM